MNLPARSEHAHALPILALGAWFKHAACLLDAHGWTFGPNLGDLDNAEACAGVEPAVEALLARAAGPVRAVAHDLHPDFHSTRVALATAARLGVPAIGVQHHHAHVGAVLAEQGLDGPVLGLVLDGTGYGGDGTVWGGEVLRADRGGSTRLGRLALLPLAGGDRAAREPWRMALALLHRSLGRRALDPANQPESLRAIDPQRQALLVEMIERGLNTPPTSSCGRLFDAVSALLGLCAVSRYEGEAAMLLEHQATLAPAGDDPGRYPVRLAAANGLVVLDSAPLGSLVLADLQAGAPVPLLARRFHQWLVDGCMALLNELRERTALTEVALSGGCLQNRLLFETLVQALAGHGFTVHTSELVPVNDGGISLGQAYLGGRVCV